MFNTVITARHGLASVVCAATFLWGLPAIGATPISSATRISAHACSDSADTLLNSCNLDALGEHAKTMATCINAGEAAAVAACRAAARVSLTEARQSCRDMHSGRDDICDLLGEAQYLPHFGGAFAANFVNPLNIGGSVRPNRFVPLIPGTTRVFELPVVDETGDHVLEVTTVTVTHKTKLIDGVTCVVVHDEAVLDGDLKESTEDWFAQDTGGNVWYCGEATTKFDHFDGDQPEDPELQSRDGSWKTARDGGKAGILMPGTPAVGKTYRQELLWSDAEDMATVIDTAGSATARGGSCNKTCVVTREFSALDPGNTELKYYAPGVGLILIVDEQTGDREELVR